MFLFSLSTNLYFRAVWVCNTSTWLGCWVLNADVSSRQMSLTYWMALLSSLNRYAKHSLFGSPSARSIRRPYENLGAYGQGVSRATYSEVILIKFRTISQGWKVAQINALTRAEAEISTHWKSGNGNALWVERKVKFIVGGLRWTAATRVAASERLGVRFGTVLFFLMKW